MNMRPRSITELTDIYGMRVIVRTSLDIPITDGVADDHFRVRRALPTMQYLVERGARVILLTHVGRDPENSTKPLEAVLQKYVPVQHVAGLVGEEVEGAIAHMKEGTVLLLENLRSDAREEENNDEFAKILASYGFFYVNDAFAVSHRAHASIVGIPKYVPSFAGITFLEEFDALTKTFTPEHPSLFILGGAKFETKQPLIQAYSSVYTHTFIGGALANDLLKGKGYEVGRSVVSDRSFAGDPLLEAENILLPTDVIAVADDARRAASVEEVRADECIYDIGPASVHTLGSYIKDAKTILWNGPLGYYEGGYDEATKECAKRVAESGAYTVVGGGDTIAAIESLGLQDSFGFLSTAGGAMLEFLEKRTLPGIEALSKE